MGVFLLVICIISHVCLRDQQQRSKDIYGVGICVNPGAEHRLYAEMNPEVLGPKKVLARHIKSQKHFVKIWQVIKLFPSSLVLS